MTQTGRIMKAISGFYYVQLKDTLVECKARGRFRKDGVTPLVGDFVEISRQGVKGTIEKIMPRRNAFIRPAVANLDVLIVIASEAIPVTEPFLVDRVTAIAGDQNVPVILCINKCDLKNTGTLLKTYRKAGYCVIPTSAVTGEGIADLWTAISGKTVVFTGNSGVGKSSILNAMCPELSITTGDISQKLGRGRHTTRHIEFYMLRESTIIGDTPGFSSFDTEQMELIIKENLQYSFPDFAKYLGKCQFHDCAHLQEPGCAVRQAVEIGEIVNTRYNSYRKLYEKAKTIKNWEMSQNVK